MTDLNIVPKKNVPVNYAYVTKEIICVKYYICLQKFETGPKFSRFGTNIPNFKKLKKTKNKMFRWIGRHDRVHILKNPFHHTLIYPLN